MRSAFVACLVSLLFGCAAYDSSDPAELERTWNAGELHVPLRPELGSTGNAGRRIYSLGDSSAVARVQEGLRGRRLPTVLYMHGCSGSSLSTFADGKLLAEAGYVVVAPESFGRKLKPQSCDGVSQTGGFHREVLGWRHAEASYALERMREFEFIDFANLFLMGHSQGGQVAATFTGWTFTGRIITGWHCSRGWAEYEGLRFSNSEPVLSIIGKDDPWYRRSMYAGDCGKHMHAFKDAKSIIVGAPMHYVNSLPGVQTEILTFLRRLTSPTVPIK